MTQYLMRCEGPVGAATISDGYDPTGNYLRHFDPNAYDGRGRAEWTADPSKAIHFASVETALATWKSTSTTRPVRPDGKPNRPLTAFSISIQPAQDHTP